MLLFGGRQHFSPGTKRNKQNAEDNHGASNQQAWPGPVSPNDNAKYHRQHRCELQVGNHAGDGMALDQVEK